MKNLDKNIMKIIIFIIFIVILFTISYILEIEYINLIDPIIIINLLVITLIVVIYRKIIAEISKPNKKYNNLADKEIDKIKNKKIILTRIGAIIGILSVLFPAFMSNALTGLILLPFFFLLLL